MSKNKNDYLVMDDRKERPLTDKEKEIVQLLDQDSEVQRKIKEFEKEIKTTF
ncbi:hypothetical protein N7O58_03295 [Enterococcus dispar]|uniref:hypothetical protein n=1 Tax=Enterococcus dispar TaxID=44009 RepID=UPI0021D47D34|nr:hypothetical protein [Enterococcus dispar]MCU7356706.1 hypothetical protein [Enterococcus dispar]